MICSQFNEMIKACAVGDLNTVVNLIPHVDVRAMMCGPLRTASMYNQTSCVLALLPHSDPSVMENQVLREAIVNRNSEIFDAVISLCDPTYHGQVFYSACILLGGEGWWEKFADFKNKVTQSDWDHTLEYMSNYLTKKQDISFFVEHCTQEAIDEAVDECIKNQNNLVVQLIDVCSANKYAKIINHCMDHNEKEGVLKVFNKMTDLKISLSESLANKVLNFAANFSDINLVKAVLPYVDNGGIVNNFVLARLIVNSDDILNIFEGVVNKRGYFVLFEFMIRHDRKRNIFLLLKKLKEKSKEIDLETIDLVFEDAAIYLNMPVLNMLAPLIENKEKNTVMEHVVKHQNIEVYNFFRHMGFLPTEESIDWSAKNKNREMVRAQMNDKIVTAQLIHSISHEGWVEELEMALKNASSDLSVNMYNSLGNLANKKEPGETWFSPTVVNKHYECLEKILCHVKKTAPNAPAMSTSNWMVDLCYHFPEDNRCLNMISQALSPKDCGHIMLKIHALCCSAPVYRGFNAIKHFVVHSDEDACTKLFNSAVDAPKKIQKKIILEAGKYVSSKNMNPEPKDWFEKQQAKTMRAKLEKNLTKSSSYSKKKM